MNNTNKSNWEDCELDVDLDNTIDPSTGMVEEKSDKYILIEDIKDIRTLEKKGDSGVESFYCEEKECVLEKDKILYMAGIHGDNILVENLINDLAEKVVNKQTTINRLNEELENDKKTLKLLLIKLDYTNVQWSEKCIAAEQNGCTYLWPLSTTYGKAKFHFNWYTK